MPSAADTLPERPRLAKRLLSWLALLLLAGHLAGAAPRLASIETPNKPLSIEARPIQAIIAQGRTADIVKAGRVQTPDKPGQGSGDPPLAALPQGIAIRPAPDAPAYAALADKGLPRLPFTAHRARAPPLA